MYSAPYLTLTAGDKGIKCPSESPEQCRKGPLGAPPFATMAILSASHATAHRCLHSLPPRAPGEAPRATRWWMRWSADAEWPPATASAFPLLLSCRVRKLVAHRASRYLVLSSRQAPLAGPCCLAGARGVSRQVLWSASVGLPGKLLLSGPCLLSLNTLFLNGSKGTTEDLGVRPESLAAGCCNCPCTSSGY